MSKKNHEVLKLLKDWLTRGILTSQFHEWMAEQEGKMAKPSGKDVDRQGKDFQGWLANNCPWHYADALLLVGRALEQVAVNDPDGRWLRLIDFREWSVPRPNWPEQIVGGHVVTFRNIGGVQCQCHPNPESQYWACGGHIELKAVALCVGQIEGQRRETANLCLVVKRRGLDPNAYALVHVNRKGQTYEFAHAPKLVYDGYVGHQFGFGDVSDVVVGGVSHGCGLDDAFGYQGAGRFVGDHLAKIEPYLMQLTAARARHG